MWIALVGMVVVIAVLTVLAGINKKGSGKPSDSYPGASEPEDDDFHIEDAEKGWGEGPIHMETTTGGSTLVSKEPEAYTKSREAVEKGLFYKKTEFEDPGDFKTADPAPAYSHLKTGRMGGSAYKTEEKDITPPEIETFYTYKARVHVRMCPFCGCENSVADERCGCCGEYI